MEPFENAETIQTFSDADTDTVGVQSSSAGTASRSPASKCAATRLKQARLRCGKSLQQIAEESCVSHRYLDAIEGRDYDRLPELTFAVGFVRSFALAVGENPEDVAACFKGEVRQSGTSRQADKPAFAPEKSERRRVPGWLAPFTGLFGAAITLAWFGGGLYLTGSASVAETGQATDLASIQMRLKDEAPEFIAHLAALSPAAHADSGDAAVGAQSLALDIETTEDTWVRISTPDGYEHWSGVLRAGEHYTPTVPADARLSASNSAALTVRVNGISLSVEGARGHVLKDAFVASN